MRKCVQRVELSKPATHALAGLQRSSSIGVGLLKVAAPDAIQDRMREQTRPGGWTKMGAGGCGREFYGRFAEAPLKMKNLSQCRTPLGSCSRLVDARDQPSQRLLGIAQSRCGGQRLPESEFNRLIEVRSRPSGRQGFLQGTDRRHRISRSGVPTGAQKPRRRVLVTR